MRYVLVVYMMQMDESIVIFYLHNIHIIFWLKSKIYCS